MNNDLINLGLIDEVEIALDQAALSLALLDHPNTDPAPYQELLNALAVRLEVVGDGASNAHERADALSAVFGEEFGFIGDEKTYDDPANADLIRVIDRRRGLPISLSILYVAVARRLGWRADVLDVPGHVLVLISAEGASVIVDPFRGGIRIGREQVTELLRAFNTHPAAAVGQVGPMPNRAILVRLLQNQATRAERAGGGRRARELYIRMNAMAPGHGPAWWERARLELIDGDIAAARSSLCAMLEITREPQLRRRVSETLASLTAT